MPSKYQYLSLFHCLIPISSINVLDEFKEAAGISHTVPPVPHIASAEDTVILEDVCDAPNSSGDRQAEMTLVLDEAAGLQ